jgi:hypothetical protein
MAQLTIQVKKKPGIYVGGKKGGDDVCSWYWYRKRHRNALGVVKRKKNRSACVSGWR